ncbi:MAG: DUF134 domain-containing protein [Clostridiales bacterium]|jgi:predicted DNA-binding protein (UPF0251 family)|nr:DUF134 domain-containing protein [Clostridiales bacterium]
MSRARKKRRVRFLPKIRYFVPYKVPENQVKENILKIEELEALRLRDIEGLDQESCAIKMNISRQTYQRVLAEARKKIVDSLVNGKAIRIEGGNFDVHIGRVKCLDCNNSWYESYDNFIKIGRGQFICPHCQSHDIICLDKKGYKYCKNRKCRMCCQKHNQVTN